MQANIRLKTGGRNIRQKESDNDDISSVSSESSSDTPLIVNNNYATTAPKVKSLYPYENAADDSSWNTVTAEANAPLGYFRELLIPDRLTVYSNMSRKEWHRDIKYCVQHRYVYCHECRELVKKAKYK
jgi:hypothetical protein